MKKAFFTALLCLSALAPLLATHIIGGSIFYKPLGGDSFEIKLVVYRDCYTGIPPFDDPASIGIFDTSWSLVNQLFIPLDPASNDTLNFQNTPLCFPLPTNVCVHRTVYSSVAYLPFQPGGYRLVYQRCCRSVLVQNFVGPLDAGMSIVCTVPEQPNRSPVLKNSLPPYGFVNKPFVFDAGAADADGDSLVYRFSFPQNGADAVNPLPQPPDVATIFDLPFEPPFDLQNYLNNPPGQYPLQIDPQTGEIKGEPNLLGLFVVAYSINEYRDGQLLATSSHDIAIQILDGQAGLMVAGEVTAENAGPLDAGEVRLIQRNPFTDSLLVEKATALDPAPAYHFGNVYTSKYLVRALPAPGSAFYATHFPTYFPDKYFWYNATEVEVCFFDATGVDILLRADSLLLAPGPGAISGKLVGPSGGEIAGFELWLMGNVSQKPVAWTVTDASGSFLFEKLPPGEYAIFANQPNTLIFNQTPPVLTLGADQPGGLSVKLLMKPDRLETVFISKTDQEAAAPVASLQISPNPASGHLRLGWPAEDILFGEILDAAGRAVLSFSGKNELEIGSLPAGVFHVEIKTRLGRANGRFVKI